MSLGPLISQLLLDLSIPTRSHYHVVLSGCNDPLTGFMPGLESIYFLSAPIELFLIIAVRAWITFLRFLLALFRQAFQLSVIPGADSPFTVFEVALEVESGVFL
jgi:hypothetical protein